MEHADLVTYCFAKLRYGWNVVALDGAIPDDELRDLVDARYDTVVARLPKRLRP